jgi:hypothetical protein
MSSILTVKGWHIVSVTRLRRLPPGAALILVPCTVTMLVLY